MGSGFVNVPSIRTPQRGREICTPAQSHVKQTPLIGLLLLLLMNTAGSVDATYERVDVAEITLSVAFAGATAESAEQTWPMD
jgi:hypothetical protein